ncbi:YceI family protein [Candidatus Nomurabacteria bacterium]|nr:YceI family protein [Candidatus Nomurabacteria bacterium]
MKIGFGIVLLLLVGGVLLIYGSPTHNTENNQTEIAVDSVIESMETRTVVDDGSYIAMPDDSSVFWSGKKPLLDGYINTGSMEVTSGSIEVNEGVVTGELVIDMDTMSVTDTPSKPGKEDVLEGHLKGEGWFNVAEYPEAKFVITEAVPQAENETSFLYDVKGELTMKGETHELTFPAIIYTDLGDGRTYASADLEFDRTKWGITAGSGSFFDNLADNVVDDMVALSFKLVAEQE